MPRCPLLTQSGHERLRIAAVQTSLWNPFRRPQIPDVIASFKAWSAQALSLRGGNATTRFRAGNRLGQRLHGRSLCARSRASPNRCGAWPCCFPKARTILKRKTATRHFCRLCSKWAGPSGRTSRSTTVGPQAVKMTLANTRRNWWHLRQTSYLRREARPSTHYGVRHAPCRSCSRSLVI